MGACNTTPRKFEINETRISDDPIGTSRSRTLLAQVLSKLHRFVSAVKIRRRESSLRVCETVSLGERRSLLVVQFESERFLISSTNHTISLLHRLENKREAQSDLAVPTSDAASGNEVG